MIDIRRLAPIRIADLEPGQLYLPTESRYERFIGGMINQYPVAVALDGEDAFHVSELINWRRPTGVLVSDVRIHVDLESARPAIEVDNLSGALLMAANGVFLTAHEGRGRYSVALRGGSADAAQPQEPMVGFMTWKILGLSEDKEMTVYFESSAKK